MIKSKLLYKPLRDCVNSTIRLIHRNRIITLSASELTDLNTRKKNITWTQERLPSFRSIPYNFFNTMPTYLGNTTSKNRQNSWIFSPGTRRNPPGNIKGRAASFYYSSRQPLQVRYIITSSDTEWALFSLVSFVLVVFRLIKKCWRYLTFDTVLKLVDWTLKLYRDRIGRWFLFEIKLYKSKK